MTKKYIFFVFISVFLLLFTIELSIRAIYFQSRSGNNSGIALALEYITKYYLKNFSSSVKSTLNQERMFQENEDLLFTKDGEKLLQELKNKYKENFFQFVEESKKIQAQLFFLYIPSGFSSAKKKIEYKNFFYSLSQDANIEFIDLSTLLNAYPRNYTTLEPEDTHLSRFGNQLLTATLEKKLVKYLNYRSPTHFSNEKRPHFFGDNKANNKTIWELNKPLPFIGNINSQGLRNMQNFAFPKKKQRILCIGDSYTFGLYLPIAHTFPYLLERTISDIEVINAGVAGYTIEDELALLKENAKYLEPDIIILQAFDNDLTDQLAFQRNIFARKKAIYKASPIEEEFFRKILAKNSGR